jgi:uncharacterized protein YwbE
MIGRHRAPFAFALVLAATGFAACSPPSSQGLCCAQGTPRSAPARVHRTSGNIGPIVTPKVPGEILGFDIDQYGNDGVFANYRDLTNGLTVLSVETFDQRTGKITNVVTKTKTRNGSYSVYGILAKDIGFVEDGKNYDLMNPVRGGKLNGTWTPPVPFLVSQIAVNQTTSRSVMLGYDARYASLPTALVVANVTGGPTKVIPLDQGVFGTGDVPNIAQDTKTNQAMIVGGNGAQLTHPTIGVVDLVKGKVKTFTGLGYGSINSIAIDSTTNTACAVTNLDEGVEFYNVETQAGFEVFLPNQGSQLQSGSQVAIDPIHGLCVITQPVSINGGTQQSAIWVYDEKGNELEGIQGFNFWFGAGLSINPTKRIGYVLNPRPQYTTLTGFTY